MRHNINFNSNTRVERKSEGANPAFANFKGGLGVRQAKTSQMPRSGIKSGNQPVDAMLHANTDIAMIMS